MQKHDIDTNRAEKLRQKRMGEDNPAWNRVTRECEECGAQIERPESMFKFEHAFCSRECHRKAASNKDKFRPPDNSHSENQLLDELKRLKKEIGRTPTSFDIQRHAKHAVPTYVRRFGSVPEARSEAGLKQYLLYGQAGIRAYEGERHQYGKNWRRKREERLEIDGYQCAVCGIDNRDHVSKYGVGLNVHHIRPACEFADLDAADNLDNLITLCSKHHRKWEGVPLRPDSR